LVFRRELFPGSRARLGLAAPFEFGSERRMLVLHVRRQELPVVAPVFGRPSPLRVLYFSIALIRFYVLNELLQSCERGPDLLDIVAGAPRDSLRLRRIIPPRLRFASVT